MEYIYRHGDVDLFQVNQLPKSAKAIDGTTLAYGEVTGHHHTVYTLSHETKIQLFERINKAVAELFIEVKDGKALLKHQEHEAIVIEPGIYKVKIERGFNPFELEYKKVID